MRATAAESIGLRYLIYAITAVATVIIARELAASGRGAYAYAIAVASTVSWISHCSVETSLYLQWSSDEGARARLAGASLALAALLGAVGVAVAAALVVLGGSESTLAPSGLLITALAAVPGTLAVLYLNSVLVNEGRIREMNLAALSSAAVYLTVVTFLAGLGQLTVFTALLVWTVNMWFPILMLVRYAKQQPGIVSPSFKDLTVLLTKGLRFHPGAVALALILRIDILILGDRVTPQQVGIYSLAVSLAELILLGTTASSQVAVRRQVQSADIHGTAEITATVSRVNLMLSAGLGIGLVAVGSWAISLVFGDSYEGTTMPLLVLMPGVIALSMLRPLAVFVTRLDRPLLVNAALISAMLVNVILNVALIPLWGIVGAAMASSIVYVGILVWGAGWFLHATGSGWRVLAPTREDVTSGLTAIMRRGQRS